MFSQLSLPAPNSHLYILFHIYHHSPIVISLKYNSILLQSIVLPRRPIHICRSSFRPTHYPLEQKPHHPPLLLPSTSTLRLPTFYPPLHSYVPYKHHHKSLCSLNTCKHQPFFKHTLTLLYLPIHKNHDIHLLPLQYHISPSTPTFNYYSPITQHFISPHKISPKYPISSLHRSTN